MKARYPELALAVVKDLRVARAPATAEDLEALETDVLAGFVLALADAESILRNAEDLGFP